MFPSVDLPLPASTVAQVVDDSDLSLHSRGERYFCDRIRFVRPISSCRTTRLPSATESSYRSTSRITRPTRERSVRNAFLMRLYCFARAQRPISSPRRDASRL